MRLCLDPVPSTGGKMEGRKEKKDRQTYRRHTQRAAVLSTEASHRVAKLKDSKYPKAGHGDKCLESKAGRLLKHGSSNSP